MKAKTIITIFVVLLLVIIIYRYFNGYKLVDHRQSTNNAQVESYNEYLKAQQAAYTDYMDRLNDQLKRSNEFMEKSAENQKKYQLLLNRWEKQADKIDLILDKLKE